jgi:hypothetical protein
MLLALEAAMNEHLRLNYPQFFDGSIGELLEIKAAPGGAGCGTWVKSGVVIPEGTVLGVYAGRLRLSGEHAPNAYIFAMPNFYWDRRLVSGLEIDGSPAGFVTRARMVNVAQYNHACVAQTVRLERDFIYTPHGRCAVIVARASSTLTGPVQLCWNYGPGYTFSAAAATAATAEGRVVQRCGCAHPAACPRGCWLVQWP